MARGEVGRQADTELQELSMADAEQETQGCKTHPHPHPQTRAHTPVPAPAPAPVAAPTNTHTHTHTHPHTRAHTHTKYPRYLNRAARKLCFLPLGPASPILRIQVKCRAARGSRTKPRSQRPHGQVAVAARPRGDYAEEPARPHTGTDGDRPTYSENFSQATGKPNNQPRGPRGCVYWRTHMVRASKGVASPRPGHP